MNGNYKNLTYSINILSRICAHMINPTEIDKRALWITIHLSDGYNNVSDNLIWNINNSINYAFRNYTKGDISNRNGFFASYDFAGTRDRNIDHKSLSVPHIHSLVILNESVKINFSNCQIIEIIKSSILCNTIINQYICDITIDKYETKDRSLLSYIDYSRKFEKKSQFEMPHLFGHYCYPHDDYKNQKTEAAKEKYRQLTTDLAERILDRESCLFTPGHHDLVMNEYEKVDEKYRSAKTSEEKKKHKASFLRGVFSDEIIHH
ncbi:hypothetical protein [Brucella anthropi]|uniref:Uncharacterized protein n=1 Tax=Brucella anthropi TaxID=529 RepID=A0A6L3ZBD1_BRUAN|nr:hypothetical protein [Brucella anthropi]KAB2773595.1 hypothetical protein F9L04_01830 [Brucella anthropi]